MGWLKRGEFRSRRVREGGRLSKALLRLPHEIVRWVSVKGKVSGYMIAPPLYTKEVIEGGKGSRGKGSSPHSSRVRWDRECGSDWMSG